MNSNENDPRHTRIDVGISKLLETLPTRPSWYDPWMRLGPESTEEERLAVYQAIRDSGLLPADAGFYLVSWQADAVAEQHAETDLKHLDERLRRIESEHGLEEDDLWEPGEAPDEYEKVLEEYQAAWEEIFSSQLEAHGEPEMAALFRGDRPEFERRSEAGRQFFHGPRPAGELLSEGDWLDELLGTVIESLLPESPMGPLALLYREEDGFWEVDVYPTPVELVGGAEDGALVSPGFSLDLEQLRSSFEEVEELGWNALGWPNGEGPFIYIEGTHQGREVYLRILAQAPEGEEPGAKIRISRRPEP